MLPSTNGRGHPHPPRCFFASLLGEGISGDNENVAGVEEDEDRRTGGARGGNAEKPCGGGGGRRMWGRGLKKEACQGADRR